jgi:ribosome-associated protein
MKVQKQDEVSTEELLKCIIEAIQDKNGRDLKLLDLQKIENSICDFFLICHGTSNTHIDAITDKIYRDAKEKFNELPFSKEGMENKTWVLLDYGNIVIHIFQEEYRRFYNLEDLWADAKIIEYKSED